MPDDQADQYGKGYITGTIVGIASTSEKQNAAWEFVKYLTTDTKAVVNFANAIHNVPSTIDALASPDVSQDPNFQTFIKIASNPNSNTTPASPNGGAYQLTLQDLGYDYESGKQTDLQAGLDEAAEPDRHRHRPGPVTVATTPATVDDRSDGRGDQEGRSARAAARGSGCATSRSCRPGCSAPGCSSSTRWSSTAYFSFTHYDGFVSPTWDGLDNWKFVFQRLPVLLAGAAQHAVVRRGAW